jgi:hypothetical protein
VKARCQLRMVAVLLLAGAAADTCLHWTAIAAHAASLPKVVLSAESLAPRPIEQRTGEAVTHDYAQAWQDLSEALNTNRSDLIGDYITGDAKLRLSRRIADQKKAGVHTKYIDNGHQVKAVFYSPDGGEMQLVDRVQLEIQIFDGNKLIYSSTSVAKYLVLMTPGSDRWYLRSLESVPENAF